jgi:hypothetical protein
MRDLFALHRQTNKHRGNRGASNAGAAALTLAFALTTSALQMVAYAGTGTPVPAQPTLVPPAGQAENQARWADLEAEGRATDGDYDGAVQAHQEAERDRLTAERLRGHSLTR